MLYSSYHCKSPNLAYLIGVIVKSDSCLHSLFNTYTKKFSNEITYFCPPNFSVPFFSNSHEIIVDSKKNILINLSSVNNPSNSNNFNVRIFCKIPDLRIKNIIKRIKSNKKIHEFFDGTFQESHIVGRLNTDLEKLSGNGKIINNEKFIAFWKYGENVSSRIPLKKYISKIGMIPIPEENFEKVSRSIDKSIPLLVKNTNITLKQFAINCDECHNYPILYENEQRARDALKDSKCGECGKKALRLTKAIQLRPEMHTVISGGAWLERLVATTINKYTKHVWAGRMYGNDEIDVIAFFCGKTFIVECKDTSFGQNDYYILLRKAENINANSIIVVTTEKLHKNVSNSIEKDFKEEKRKILVIEEKDANKITSHLNEYFQKVLDKYICAVITRPYNTSRFNRPIRHYSPYERE